MPRSTLFLCAIIATNSLLIAQDQDARDKVFYPGDTERVKPLARKFFSNILLDQKEIWTSPFRMNRDTAKLWIGFGAVTAGLIASDQWSSKQLENSRGQVRWGGRVSQIGASYTLIPLAAGFYGYGAIFDEPKARETGVLGAEAMVDSLIVVEVLKTISGRNRPDSKNDKGKFFAGGRSFPSGHAIASWALASVISHEYSHTKWVPVVSYGLAAIVSTSRFAAQKHYASDIVVGGTMGWFIGRYVYKTHQDHSLHRHGWLRPQIMPRIDPQNREFGIALQFGN
jgi:hypothetical protein